LKSLISPCLQLPISIGSAGWSIPKQSSADFPSAGGHLERYSQVLNACEINSSFYRPHKQETWERWANATPVDFRFSVKAARAITHEGKLSCTAQELSAFLHQVSLLRNKLGPILFQLPPSLKFEHAGIKAFLSSLRESHNGDVAFEPRHGSWFKDSAEELLNEFRIARVAADPACVPAASEPGGFSGLAYFRLHGSPRRYYSSYDQNLLNKLAVQIANLARGARVWCIFDNTASGSAIENAIQLSTDLVANYPFRKTGGNLPPANSRKT
jgi:uncharacterized protein YecE (DUF72 family)